MTPMMRMRLANKGRGEFQAQADTLWLYDFIASDDEEAAYFGGVSPRQFIEALKATSGPVTLRINSPGGSVFGAQAMVSAMRAHGEPITAQVDALAASAASVIAAECAECSVIDGAMLMIHNAWGLTIGNADDHRSSAELLDKMDRQIAATYARRAGDDDPDKYMALMAAETWFTAAEAVEAKLADRVIRESAQRPQARWDLSAYRAPVVAEPEPAPAPASDNLRLARMRRVAARIKAHPI